MVTEPIDRTGELPARVVAAFDRIANAQRSHRRAVAAVHGLTPLQAELLMTLAQGEPPAPTAGLLAQELGISQPTVSDSLQALTRKQLLTRKSDPTDSRRANFRLTPEGERVVSRLAAEDRVLMEAVAELPAGDQEALLAQTLTLIAGLVERGVVTVARTCLTCRFYEDAGDGSARCALLNAPLEASDLRVNCPEHEPRLHGMSS